MSNSFFLKKKGINGKSIDDNSETKDICTKNIDNQVAISIPKLIVPIKTPRNTKQQLQKIIDPKNINSKKKIRNLTPSNLFSNNKSDVLSIP